MKDSSPSRSLSPPLCLTPPPPSSVLGHDGSGPRPDWTLTAVRVRLGAGPAARTYRFDPPPGPIVRGTGPAAPMPAVELPVAALDMPAAAGKAAAGGGAAGAIDHAAVMRDAGGDGS